MRLSVAWRGFRGLLAEGSLVWLKAEGHGGVWVNSYGGIEEIVLGPGEEMTLDNFHFVAMEPTLSWKVKKFGGLKSFLFGKEGVVIHLKGPGKILVQTRILPPFAYILKRFLPSG